MSHATVTRQRPSGGARVRRAASRESPAASSAPFTFHGGNISWWECTLVRIHLQSPNANTFREVTILASQTWTCPGSPEEHQGDTQTPPRPPEGEPASTLSLGAQDERPARGSSQ